MKRIETTMLAESEDEMSRFSLIGVDGNAFSVMGYTAKALKRSGHSDLVNQMHKEATSGDYDNLLRVCQKDVDIANEEVEDEDY